MATGSPSISLAADTILHLKNGVIECLEIWNKNGNEYPMEGPNSYELEQVWEGKDKKRKIVRAAEGLRP